MGITQEQVDAVRIIAQTCRENHFNTCLQIGAWFVKSRDSESGGAEPPDADLKNWREKLIAAKDEFDRQWTAEIDDAFLLNSPWSDEKRFGERLTACQRARDLCCDAAFAVWEGARNGISAARERVQVAGGISEEEIDLEWRAVRRSVTSNIQSDANGPRGESQANKNGLTKKDLAIAALVADPGLSIREIAKKIGVGKDSLYRIPEFKKFFDGFKALHSDGRGPQRGTKEGGIVEACEK